MDSHHHLLSTTDSFFRALAANQPPLKLLSYFSTTNPVSIQHAPRTCPNPHTSRLHGLNAIRSYFDLLATHWERVAITQHSRNVVSSSSRAVTTSASVTWRWKKSGRSWNEDFTCTLEFDDHSKITHFVVVTESGPSTCIMRAVDTDSAASPSSSSSPTRGSSGIIKVASPDTQHPMSLPLFFFAFADHLMSYNTIHIHIHIHQSGCARASVSGLGHPQTSVPIGILPSTTPPHHHHHFLPLRMTWPIHALPSRPYLNG
ncbi:hypothetical protein D9756_005114 [Leucocoprinus leucothites]|uniref:Uncharacterized protein n=1 Tax=Leucocoprinus leucothites TaxID=201217 RepID=A0A8H5LL37_9AGAR|nr:hypothetical protein D9756_005114 [Leucoagaricus leucothites]